MNQLQQNKENVMLHKIKTLAFIVGFWACLMGLMYYGIFVMKAGNKAAATPVYVEYWIKGDTLLPDMVCPDTLIVTNAKGLNEGFALLEQGYRDFDDYSIDSLLHMNCRIK